MRFTSIACVLLFVTASLAGSWPAMRRATKSAENSARSPTSSELHSLQSRSSGFWPGYTSTTSGATTCDWWSWFNKFSYGGATIDELRNCTNSYISATNYFYLALDVAYDSGGGPALHVPDRTCTQPIPQGAKILVPINNGAWWNQDCCSTDFSALGYTPPPGCSDVPARRCNATDNLAMAIRLNDAFGPPGNAIMPTNFSLTLQYENFPEFYPQYERIQIEPCIVAPVMPPPSPATNAGADGNWVTLDTTNMPTDGKYVMRVNGNFGDFGSFSVTYHFRIAGLVHAE